MYLFGMHSIATTLFLCYYLVESGGKPALLRVCLSIIRQVFPLVFYVYYEPFQLCTSVLHALDTVSVDHMV